MENIKNSGIYKVISEFVSKKISANEFERQFAIEWRIKNSFSDGFEFSDMKGKYNKHIFEAIDILLSLIFESYDAYNSNPKEFGFDKNFDITSEELYGEVKNRFKKINILLSILY